MTLPVQVGVSPAFASWGRWVAYCSHRYACDGAATLQRFQAGFICQSCGRGTDVVWPSATMVAGVERLLTLRPHYKNRNWLPEETLHDLLVENAEHGVLIAAAAELPAGSAMLIQGDTIMEDALPMSPSRPELVH
jgi:hypothetical protein